MLSVSSPGPGINSGESCPGIVLSWSNDNLINRYRILRVLAERPGVILAPEAGSLVSLGIMTFRLGDPAEKRYRSLARKVRDVTPLRRTLMTLPFEDALPPPSWTMVDGDEADGDTWPPAIGTLLFPRRCTYRTRVTRQLNTLRDAEP